VLRAADIPLQQNQRVTNQYQLFHATRQQHGSSFSVRKIEPHKTALRNVLRALGAPIFHSAGMPWSLIPTLLKQERVAASLGVMQT
jgi:hypothetical protein